ncbi:siderophore-iron reductase FhuF [Halomonas sp. M5N1S17]|uniref:siderophore-iron reductase FhuF n=1 Tax=Halomonas alkalisoli TaxID=2907158 RepID=UPI001F3114E4|nr:siderophore-iron reductase FhuF [Halomonas alkalisoli]MCE9663398.1 siderophore-iron reductase FhuF [Halomonas alkalisoli]
MTAMMEYPARLGDPAEALLALYRQPPLDSLRPPGFGTHEVETLTAAALLDQETLHGLLQRFTATFGEGADQKAATSIWSKYLFSLVSIPTLVANLLLGRALPVRPEALRVELGERGEVMRLWLRDGGQPLASLASDERFTTLFDDLCAPVIGVLAAESGLSPKVFWSNLGHYVEYIAKTCSRHPRFPGAGEPLLRFLDTRILPDGRRNPLYQPVRYLDLGGEAPKRVRRLCCVKYRLPDEALCGGCPLKPENRPANRRREGCR